MTAEPQTLRGFWLGRRRYASADALQRSLFELRKSRRVGDVLLLLEHEPVVTLGRGAQPQHVLAPELCEARGIDLVDSDRGGEVTLHAPGQLVGYPILCLAPDRQDVRRYVRDLSAIMQSLVADFGVSSGQVEGLVGLWVDAEEPSRFRGAELASRLAKIGAIGVRLSRWVTLHGFALNLQTDLSLYDLIVPCGVTRHGVCSLASLVGDAPSPQQLARRAFELACDRLERRAGPFADLSELDDVRLLETIATACAARSVAGVREVSV